MLSRFIYFIFLAIGTVITFSCKAVGPDYKAPVTPVPDGWTRVLEGEKESSRTGSERWWADFKDKDLNRLLATAKKNNPDIKRSRARVKEAWQQRRVIRAALFPQSEFFGSHAEGLGDFGNGGINLNPGISSDSLAQFNFGWELDIFGGIRRQVESVTSEYEASVEGWRDFHVIVTAEVALHYIALRTLDERLQVSRDGIKSYKQVVDLTNARLEEGVGAEVDALESSARLKQQEATIPQLESERAAVFNRLAALVGTYPAQLRGMLKPTAPIPFPPRKLATGLPADLLRSRPDIRRAERKLQAQSARIGMATANLYPSLSISGAITYERSITSTIVDTFRRDFGLGPRLRWRIFKNCADHARIKEMEAGLEGVIATYEETVLNAVAQVEESLAGWHFEKQALVKLKSASEDYRKTAEMMEESYLSGLVDLRRLLNARQDALDTGDEQAASKGRVSAHSVRLFKALGGGPLASPKGTETLIAEN